MDLGRALRAVAERFPERIGVGGGRPMTFREWDARTNRIARAFASLGIEHGDRVALVLSNSETLASIHLAMQKLGAASTPLNVRYAAQEMAYCVGDAEAKVVVTDDTTVGFVPVIRQAEGTDLIFLHDGRDAPEGARPLEELVDEQPEHPIESHVTEEDISVMLYTSGTTGRPKGVPRTHRAEFAASLAHVVQARYRSGESTLGAMPMYHTMGMRSLLSMVLIGGKFVPLPVFSTQAALELIEAEDISALYLVPTAFWALVQETGVEGAAKHVRKLAYAGAPMTSALTEQLASLFEPEVFINHYGSTEVYTYTIEEQASAKPGSAGRPGIFSRMRVAVPDPEGRVGPQDLVQPGDTGELIADLGSDEAFSGYWHRPDADQKGLRGGWFFTGDLGYVDDRGDFWVVGRVDDMIITGGENVHPIEVEDVLARCPEVGEATVVGLPDEKWGQAVTAFVVPSRPGDRQEIARAVADWVRRQADLAAYKRPKRIVVVEQIPKSPVGKILRRKLVEGAFEPLAEAPVPRRSGS